MSLSLDSHQRSQNFHENSLCISRRRNARDRASQLNCPRNDLTKLYSGSRLALEPQNECWLCEKGWPLIVRFEWVILTNNSVQFWMYRRKDGDQHWKKKAACETGVQNKLVGRWLNVRFGGWAQPAICFFTKILDWNRLIQWYMHNYALEAHSASHSHLLTPMRMTSIIRWNRPFQLVWNLLVSLSLVLKQHHIRTSLSQSSPVSKSVSGLGVRLSESETVNLLVDHIQSNWTSNIWTRAWLWGPGNSQFISVFLLIKQAVASHILVFKFIT